MVRTRLLVQARATWQKRSQPHSLLPLCSKKAHFCNAECQKAAWKEHKKVCLPPAKVYETKCSECGAFGEEVVKDNGKCTHCTKKQ